MGEEIVPSDQSRIKELANFIYFLLGKAFEEQIKTIEEQGKKQGEAFEVLKPDAQKLTIKDAIPENALSEEAKNELNKIKEIEKMINRWILVYRTNQYTYCFKNFWTINTLGSDICNGEITLKEADKDQSDLLVELLNFKSKIKPQNPEEQHKKYILKDLYALFDCKKRVLDAFDSGMLPIKIEGTGFSDKVLDKSNLKISPKQMLQRLPIALAQVNACNMSEKLLNEIRQIIFFASSKRNH